MTHAHKTFLATFNSGAIGLTIAHVVVQVVFPILMGVG